MKASGQNAAMLLKYMGGLQGLRNASVEEIAKSAGYFARSGRKYSGR
ncbi:hypothetical protein ACNKHV_12025 [Shigella flexneri]